MFFLVDIVIGLSVTLKYYFRFPKATIQYPEQVKTPSDRFRGLLRLHRDSAGVPLCIACKMCQRVCPQTCFDIEGQKDESNKMRPTKYDWNLERCTFCGHCVEICPTKAILFSKEFCMSTYDRSKLIFHHDQMYEEFDVQAHFLGEKKQRRKK